MDRQRIGGIEVTRIVEIEGANSPRFTGYLFPDLTAEHLAAQAASNRQGRDQILPAEQAEEIRRKAAVRPARTSSCVAADSS